MARTLLVIFLICALTGDNESVDKELPVVENLLQGAEGIYSGGEPRDAKAFQSLRKLGIRTIVSVDGKRPNVEQARRHGLRYVHIPIVYDGINLHQQLSLVHLAQEAKGPVYVHCHHGRHRGPAATAILCLAKGHLNHRQANDFLQRAGTSETYTGLWRDVDRFQLPPATTDLPPLVEIAQVSLLTTAMADIDRSFGLLKLCRQADWKTPKSHPDLAPAELALLLKEGFRESQRNLEKGSTAEMASWLQEAEATAAAMETALRENRMDSIEKSYAQLEESCARCHRRFRD